MRRLKSSNSKGRAIELHVLARRMMRRVIGGDHVDAAIRQPCDQRVAILARSQRRIHLVAASRSGRLRPSA